VPLTHERCCSSHCRAATGPRDHRVARSPTRVSGAASASERSAVAYVRGARPARARAAIGHRGRRASSGPVIGSGTPALRRRPGVLVGGPDARAAGGWGSPGCDPAVGAARAGASSLDGQRGPERPDRTRAAEGEGEGGDLRPRSERRSSTEPITSERWSAGPGGSAAGACVCGRRSRTGARSPAPAAVRTHAPAVLCRLGARRASRGRSTVASSSDGGRGRSRRCRKRRDISRPRTSAGRATGRDRPRGRPRVREGRASPTGRVPGGPTRSAGRRAGRGDEERGGSPSSARSGAAVVALSRYPSSKVMATRRARLGRCTSDRGNDAVHAARCASCCAKCSGETQGRTGSGASARRGGTSARRSGSPRGPGRPGRGGCGCDCCGPRHRRRPPQG
jgi:hypothetical protein